MSTHDQLAETQGILEGVVSKWSPSTDEQFDIRMMRALLQLNAYEQDVARVNRGEPPIRTSYPIPLPCTKQGAALELLEALDGKLKAAHALADQVDETLRAKRERDEARGANILNRNAVRRLSAEKDAILADLPHALGTCGCRPTTPTVEWGEGDWPSEHTAAVERLKERIA